MDAKSPGSPFLVILDHWATCTANLPLKTLEIILQPGHGSVFLYLKEFIWSVWWLWAWPQHHTDGFCLPKPPERFVAGHSAHTGARCELSGPGDS